MFSTPACSGGNSLFPRKPTLLLTNTSCGHVPDLSMRILRVLWTTENQESRNLRDESQQLPSVIVLSGAAVAITNVVTASEFLAGG